MKLHLHYTAISLFISLGLSAYSFGQNMVAKNSGQTETTSFSSLDKDAGENEAEANFSTLFPEASQQKWSTSQGSHFVSFFNAGRKARASFDGKGHLNYVITDCGINHLPVAFSRTIKKNYANYLLFHAIEINAYGQTAYQAILEDAKTFITLKFTNDGVEEIQEVKK